MNEQILTPSQEPLVAPSGAGTIFDEAPACPLPVNVSSGPYAESLPVGNLTVGEIRRRFRDRLDLAPDSQAIVDGQDVGDDVVVRPGQALMFARRAGEKGGFVCQP